ncbi:MAG: polyprenol monophosphomannose synthase [Patescibacteria group bacterium]
MKIGLLIGTYNEAENIKNIVAAVFSQNIAGLEIVIIDDNSPDGTGQIADGLKSQDRRVHVIHRPSKLGLGTAYIAGIKYAFERGAEYIIEMDADFSHDPKRLPVMIERLEKDADVVIGSRFVEWGKNDVDFIRRVVSRFGGIYTRLVLGPPINDFTGGFNAFRRKVLESIGLEKIRASNFSFHIETKYRAYKKKFRVVEIPIIFPRRKSGKTKFYFRMLLESMWSVLKLRFRKID